MKRSGWEKIGYRQGGLPEYRQKEKLKGLFLRHVITLFLHIYP